MREKKREREREREERKKERERKRNNIATKNQTKTTLPNSYYRNRKL